MLGILKLLALLILAFMLIRTTKHLDDKYAPPPTPASAPAPAPHKVQ